MLFFKDAGKMDYVSALSLQEELVERKIQGGLSADLLLLLEHPSVFTIGRSGSERHLLRRGNLPLYRTSRGGDITYHGPGQLVAYPIVDLKSKLRRDVHLYLYRLEKAAIATLRSFGVIAGRNPPWTGVWVEDRKIASIGIAVKRGVTYHGIALNRDPDLTPFGWIIPCGLPWAKVTSMKLELGQEISARRVKDEFVKKFAQYFGYAEVQELCQDDIPTGSKSDSLEAPIISGSKEF